MNCSGEMMNKNGGMFGGEAGPAKLHEEGVFCSALHVSKWSWRILTSPVHSIALTVGE